MSKRTILVPIFSLFVLLIFASSSLLIAQQNEEIWNTNPNVDHLPLEFYLNYVPSEVPPTDAVVTVDGYDNYNIGTDFAEPHMSSNPLAPTEFFNAYNINGAHRSYNGHDWQNSTPGFGTGVQGDPVTAYDSQGNLYYMSMYGSISGARVIKSTDNGATWAPSVIAVSGGDRCWMAADQTSGPYSNYVYATMTSGSFNGHNIARSTDGGASFNLTFTAFNSPLPGAMVAVGPDVPGGNISGGCVYFVTNNGSTFSSTYRLYRSTDGGATFSLMSTNFFANYVGSNVNGRHSVQNMRLRPYPFISADNSNGTYRGRLYIVYASNTPAGNGNKPDIFCRYSDDQGATWSSAVVVNDDPNTTDNNQFQPAPWCDLETGRLYIHWMDTRDTPTSDSAYIYASYSDDGGQTFVENQRISNAKMKINCTTCGGGGSPRYQGDYDATTSNSVTSLNVWTDFRNGNFGSYVGYFPDFAMLASPALQTIPNDNGEAFFTVEVPDVKLYTHDAIFTAEVSPTPASGTISLDFVPSNTISSFPGSTQLRASTSGFVTIGTYTITVTGAGPNGTPVHKREVMLSVEEVPVELTSFSAEVTKSSVVLDWITATEVNNLGFEVHRSYFDGSDKSDWVKIGFVEGIGNSTEHQSYQFIDEVVSKSGMYYYRLKQIDFGGIYEYSETVQIEVTKPLSYELSQNYPNPFNPSTTINYSLPENAFVSLKVYDVPGKEVSNLVNEEKEAGTYQFEFDARNLTSGIYFYTLQSGNFKSSKKLILVK